jgi:hypothetical protein
MNSKIKRGENQEQGEAELSGKYVVMNWEQLLPTSIRKEIWGGERI